MTEGTRSNLWVNMREAINQLRPRLVVWENVRGALSATAASESDMEPGGGPLGEGLGRSGHLRALGRVLGDLAELGYDAQWTLVRASDVGAPHHRARVFLIAYPADAERIGVQAGGQPQSGTAEVTEPVDRQRALPDDLTHPPTPNASDGSGGGQTTDKRQGHSHQLIDAVLDLDLMKTGGRIDHLPTPKASDGMMGRPRTSGRPIEKATFLGTIITVMENGESVFGKYAPVVRRWEGICGAPAPAPTELNRNGKPRLSAQFAEWMMGLPAGWVTAVPDVTRAQQLKALGNGVCPQQAAAALTHLLTEAA